jgi:hypothetical protein
LEYSSTKSSGYFEYLAKKKLDISEEKDITIYTEDGTEIDEETFNELDSGSTFKKLINNS